ncbi:MAG: hypothetical protein N2483_05935 [Burkholderiaceae bacterium]|nr:hypothetical protein [Burkholderiaceae bacterium]
MPDRRRQPRARDTKAVGGEPTLLLDVNVLLALAWPQHVHHVLTQDWFARLGHKRWATCQLTQLAFIRLSSNRGFVADAVSPLQALTLLCTAIAAPGHVYWAERGAPADDQLLALPGLVGQRLISDAHLLSLAVVYGGQVATLDRGLLAFAKAHGHAASVAWLGA